MSDVIAGAEPFEFAGERCSVLVLHGFTGSTQSMRYLGERLHADFGFEVLGPRLAGHGTSPDDLATTGYLDWIASAEAALDRLAERGRPVFVTGLSMGGMLTLHFAGKHADRIAGAIPINAVAGEQNGILAEAILNAGAPERIPGIGSDIKAPGVTELAYPEVPVACLREVYLAQAAIGDTLHKIRCPIMIVQSREDHVVMPANSHRIARGVSSSDVRQLWLDNSYHVATLDNDKELIVRRTGRFINEILDDLEG